VTDAISQWETDILSSNGLMSLQTNDPVDIISECCFVADALVVFVVVVIE
tara:strand:- start:413 stop:562 length:150 start_codon:yes stop_codon:yes gene_type:complete